MDAPWPGPWLALGLALAGPWPGLGWPLAWPWLALGLALAGPWPGPGWPLAWPWLTLGLALAGLGTSQGPSVYHAFSGCKEFTKRLISGGIYPTYLAG